MRIVGKKNFYSFLVVLVLFCVFAMVFLLLVSVGGGVYKKTVNRMDESYEIRTTLSYIANKVRSAESENVRVFSQDGQNILAINDMVGEEEYVTYIYFYDGLLKELYQKKGKPVAMDFGTEIVQTGSVDIVREKDLLTISMKTSGGTSESMTIYLPEPGGEDVV